MYSAGRQSIFAHSRPDIHRDSEVTTIPLTGTVVKSAQILYLPANMDTKKEKRI